MSARSRWGFALVACLTVVVFASLLPLDGEAGPRFFLFRKRPPLYCPLPPIPPPSEATVVAPRLWPMFGGTSQRNMVNLLETNLPAKWSFKEGKRKNIKWVADLGTKAYGGPAIAGGRIFIGTNNQNPRDPASFKDGRPIDLGVMMCFRESDGAFLWQAVHEKLPLGRVQDWPLQGICSVPAVEGERIYYVSNRCELICASVFDGKAIWTLDMRKELGVFPHNMSSCSPLIADDTVFVVTSNGVDGGHISIPAPAAPSFLAVNKNTGKVLWQNNAPTAKLVGADPTNPSMHFRQLVNRGEVLMHGQWSNPAYGVVNGQPQVVFPGGDGWLYSFTPHGELLWRFDCNPKYAKYVLGAKGTRNDFIATPVIYKNRVYIGTGQDPEHLIGEGHFWCIDMTRRGDVSAELVVNWNAVPPQTRPNPDSAMVWHYGGPTTKPDRAKLRRNYYFGRTMSTCAIHEDILYVADLNGLLHCLDADTGKVYWTHDTNSDIWSSPLWADGKIYLGNDDDSVFVFQHGKAKKLLAENEVEGPVRATPVALNGVLYITTGSQLYAIAADK